MNKFDSLDSFSYQCGVIDAFNEVVKAGVKRIALSHPTDTLAECQALIPFSEADLPAIRQPFLRRGGAAAHRPVPRLVKPRQV